ncbi:MAG TPA: flagellar hook-associated protein 3 [Ignavibacteria bacterium]|nr:flagellar hook-associated protein 3 [Ignavibacteria bacterium]
MRISDLMLSNDFVTNFNKSKTKVNDLQILIATGNKINKPSDSPEATSRLLGLRNQSQQIDTYNKNIESGLSYMQNTTTAMESIQGEITNVMVKLSNLGNVAASSSLNNFADQIDASLNEILNFSNLKSNGKYLFGGTDFSSKPFGFSSDKSAILVKAGDISGKQSIRTSQNTFQKINMTGTEVFGTIVNQIGNIDSATGIGSTVSSQTNVYDTSGVQYTLKVDYKKTALNKYTMSYDITDSSNNSVFTQTPATKALAFNSSTGYLETVDGQPPKQIRVKPDKANIDFTLDQTSIKEAGGSTSLAFSANQKMNIFNTLLNIKNSLRAGKVPTDEQIKSVSDFNNNLLDNIAKAGNSTNQLNNAKDMLNSQKTQIEKITSSIQGVDMAKAIMELQAQNYLLQVSYKLAASISTKSLLDYL